MRRPIMVKGPVALRLVLEVRTFAGDGRDVRALPVLVDPEDGLRLVPARVFAVDPRGVVKARVMVERLAADARGFAADARGFAADARGFAADARGFAADARGFAADARGFADMRVTDAVVVGDAPDALRAPRAGGRAFETRGVVDAPFFVAAFFPPTGDEAFVAPTCAEVRGDAAV